MAMGEGIPWKYEVVGSLKERAFYTAQLILMNY